MQNCLNKDASFLTTTHDDIFLWQENFVWLIGTCLDWVSFYIMFLCYSMISTKWLEWPGWFKISFSLFSVYGLFQWSYEAHTNGVYMGSSLRYEILCKNIVMDHYGLLTAMYTSTIRISTKMEGNIPCLQCLFTGATFKLGFWYFSQDWYYHAQWRYKAQWISHGLTFHLICIYCISLHITHSFIHS